MPGLEKGGRSKGLLPLAALLRFPGWVVKENPNNQRAAANLSSVPTANGRDAGLTQPEEFETDLLRRDRLPQLELGGAFSMINLHKNPCTTPSKSRSTKSLHPRSLCPRLLAFASI